MRNLPEFIKQLEGKGITLTEGYKKSNPEMGGIATAVITDPWGVRIELTEGLRD